MESNKLTHSQNVLHIRSFFVFFRRLWCNVTQTSALTRRFHSHCVRNDSRIQEPIQLILGAPFPRVSLRRLHLVSRLMMCDLYLQYDVMSSCLIKSRYKFGCVSLSIYLDTVLSKTYLQFDNIIN
jgi:hypothetical protein